MADKKITFEDAMDELQKISTLLEEGNLSLDDSVKSFEKAMKLIEFCRESLDRAESKFRILDDAADKNTEV